MGAEASRGCSNRVTVSLALSYGGSGGPAVARMEDSGIQGLRGRGELRHRACATCSAHNPSHGPGQSPVMSTGTWATQFGFLGSASHWPSLKQREPSRLSCTRCLTPVCTRVCPSGKHWGSRLSLTCPERHRHSGDIKDPSCSHTFAMTAGLGHWCSYSRDPVLLLEIWG